MDLASPEQDDTANSSTLRTAELHLIGGSPQRCLDTLAEAAPPTSAEGAFDRGLLLARALADTGNYPAAAERATNLAAGSDPLRVFNRSSLMVRLSAESGAFDDAYESGLQLLEEAERAFGKPSPEHLRALNLLSWVASRSLRHAEALQLAEQAVLEASKTVSVTHPEFLESQNNLARFAHRAGQTERAVLIVREVVSCRREVLGDQHQKTLTSIDNLAVYLEHMGETDEALDLIGTALQGWEATLGLEHPKALPPRVHRIRMMTHTGQVTVVVEDALSTLRSHEQLLGPAHGNSVNAAEVAAACFIAAGRTDLSETLREFCDRAHSAGASAVTLSALTKTLGGWVV